MIVIKIGGSEKCNCEGGFLNFRVCVFLKSAVSLKVKLRYTLFFYKKVGFPAQAEYSYFSADFRLKIFFSYS